MHLSPCIRLRLGLSYGPFGNGVVEGSDKNEQSISEHLGQARVSQGSQAEEGWCSWTQEGKPLVGEAQHDLEVTVSVPLRLIRCPHSDLALTELLS